MLDLSLGKVEELLQLLKVSILVTGGMYDPLNKLNNWSTPASPSQLQLIVILCVWPCSDCTLQLHAAGGQLSCNHPSVGRISLGGSVVEFATLG